MIAIPRWRHPVRFFKDNPKLINQGLYLHWQQGNCGIHHSLLSQTTDLKEQLGRDIGNLALEPNLLALIGYLHPFQFPVNLHWVVGLEPIHADYHIISS
jgi:hypothetical protein